MITEKDLEEAIAECHGVRKPDANTCSKLASFYIIRDHMFKEETPTYSYATEKPEVINLDRKNFISYQSKTEFSELVDGKEQEKVLPILDELMSTISVLNPRLYRSVIRKLEEST